MLGIEVSKKSEKMISLFQTLQEREPNLNRNSKIKMTSLHLCNGIFGSSYITISWLLCLELSFDCQNISDM